MKRKGRVMAQMIPMSQILCGMAWLCFSSQVLGEEPGKRYAVLIGVEDYQHAKLREPVPLKYAVDDVTELGEILKKSGYEVTLLTDETGKSSRDLLPTRKNIFAKIGEVAAKLKREDTVLIAMTGHGLQFPLTRDAFFCPIDGHPSANGTDSLVSIRKIYDVLDQSFAGVKVILIDANRKDPDSDRVRGLDADNAPSPPKGVAVLFSCSAGERAFEHDKLQHGIFIHHVLEGLGGLAANRGGNVTFDSLSAYVRGEVPKTMQRLLPDQQQSPNMNAELIGEPQESARLVLLKRSGSSRKGNPSGDAPPLLTVPFNLSKGVVIQADWGEYLGTEVEIENSIGMKLTLIPPGEFQSSSEEGGAGRDIKPVDQVRITKPFFLGTHEVTVGNFRKFVTDARYLTEAEKDGMGGYGYDGKKVEKKPEYSWKNSGLEQTDDHPVENVSWNDANKFCEWLSRRERVAYRLPTAAEWEYSCRAGTKGTYVTGDDPEELAEVGNVADGTARKKFTDWTTISAEDGYVFTAPVGSFRMNPFGLYDMHGNVSEWCSDSYVRSYTNLSQKHRKRMTPVSKRVTCGCGSNNKFTDCRPSHRRRWDPSFCTLSIGFRVARVP